MRDILFCMEHKSMYHYSIHPLSNHSIPATRLFLLILVCIFVSLSSISGQNDSSTERGTRSSESKEQTRTGKEKSLTLVRDDKEKKGQKNMKNINSVLGLLSRMDLERPGLE